MSTLSERPLPDASRRERRPSSQAARLSRRPHAASCESCAAFAKCPIGGQRKPALQRTIGNALDQRTVPVGQRLYQVGERFQYIYAIRSGSFKSVVLTVDGREQITNFSIVGDALGLDGVAYGQYPAEAVAVEDSSVCYAPFDSFTPGCRGDKEADLHLYRMFSEELVRRGSLLVLLGTMTAQERVCAFLADLSARFERLGYSPTAFNLKLTRAEIGNLLGLTSETVSRIFGQLMRSSIVKISGRSVMVLDLQALREASCRIPGPV